MTIIDREAQAAWQIEIKLRVHCPSGSHTEGR